MGKYFVTWQFYTELKSNFIIHVRSTRIKALTWFALLLGERQILHFVIFWSVLYESMLTSVTYNTCVYTSSLQVLGTMVIINRFDEA